MSEQTEDCKHTVSMGREGERGKSWCVACGALVLDIAERPCGECKHFRMAALPRSDRDGICAPMLMRVLKDMHVTYNVTKGRTPGREGGLCWEAVSDAS